MSDTIDPRQTALLVMDYQNGIVGSYDVAEEMKRTADAITTVRARGGRIGYVRVGFTDADFDAVPATSQFAAMLTPERRPAMHADSPGTAVHDDLAPEPGDIVVRKSRVGAFSTTDLDEQLRAAGVTTLILAGISTSGVVLSTVRDGADRDYRLVVLADACADPAPGVHEFLVEKVFPRQAQVTTTAQLSELLG
ncbi:cysteine hydrolase family protein [Amycolatopsis sp. GM8]|uniref:cysteine hydrolase family protein n=1 Tax=Amycolatopsis sp. GM8 TaxID=2896530 RepID=UPI001F405E3F|nr:cysteine hydrolase [Amycolatopsis sp. GM8]